MSEWSKREGSEPPESENPNLSVGDVALLSAIAGTKHDQTTLTLEQEKLLDDWLAGRLGSDAASQAEELVRHNRFASEYVLEQRLLAAANQGPPVPTELEARILKLATPPRRFFPDLRWPTSSRWQWTGLGGALATIAILAGVGLQNQLAQSDGPATLQVAMADLGDRSSLFEPSDIRIRGAANNERRPNDQRFRNADISSDLLRRLVAGTTVGKEDLQSSDVASLLKLLSTPDSAPVRILVDSALAARMRSGVPVDRIAVRIYDLADPRSADILKQLGPGPSKEHLFLLAPVP